VDWIEKLYWLMQQKSMLVNGVTIKLFQSNFDVIIIKNQLVAYKMWLNPAFFLLHNLDVKITFIGLINY
jgi:hypothetical protein